MDRYSLRSDPMDNRLVRFSNFMVMLSCLCDCLSMVIRDLRDCADLMRALAKCVFYCTFGCMASQILNEVSLQRRLATESASRTPSTQEVTHIKIAVHDPVDYKALASAPKAEAEAKES